MTKTDEEYIKALTPQDQLCLAFAHYAESRIGNRCAVADYLEYFRKVDKFIEERPGIAVDDSVVKDFLEKNKPWSEQQWREIKNRIVADQIPTYIKSESFRFDKEYVQGLTLDQQYILILVGYMEEKRGMKGVVAEWLDYYHKVDKLADEHPSMDVEDLAFKNFVRDNRPKWNEQQRIEIECEMIEMMATQSPKSQQQKPATPKTEFTHVRNNQNQLEQNIAPASLSQERTPFTKHSAFRLTVVLICIVVVFSIAQQRKTENQTQKEIEARRMQNLINQGYRIQPDGSLRMATQEQLWREGSVYDHKYYGKDKSGKLIEIYEVNGQQKVFGKLQGYDRDSVYGDISVQGEWVGKGKIKARDAEGNEYEIEVTGKE